MPSAFYWLSHLSFNLGEKFEEKNKTISPMIDFGYGDKKK